MSRVTQIRTTLARATPGDWTAALLARAVWPAAWFVLTGVLAS